MQQISFNTQLVFGIQGSLSDFAYTSEYYYRQRSIGQHLGIFANSFISGLVHYGTSDIKPTSPKNRLYRFGLGSVNYFSDYMIITAIQGYNPFNYQYSGKKVGISQSKNLFFNLIIDLGKKQW